MKKIFLASACLLALTGAASAADLAARPYTKAPVAVASFYNWSGFYLGANAGGGSSHNCWDTTAVAGAAVAVTAEGCHDATGAIVGGQIGYRWQAASWVFGLEAQGDWADLKGSNVSSPAAFSPLVNNTKIDAIGLFTGQVGYAWNNVLWYVKGGAAVTHNKFSGTLAGVTFGEATETRWGGAVGTGIEFGFAPNWSVGVEYNHLFMGKHTDTFTFLGVDFRSDSIKQDVDMATVRVNYTFGGPVVAKY